MYWSQSCNRIRSSSLTFSKLSSSNNICKNQFKSVLPPSYEREIWHTQRANADQVQRAIEQLSWEKSFRNLNINETVSLLNKTIKNILPNYILHETITCDDKGPPCFKKNIKQLIQEENNIYKSYILRDKNPQIFNSVKGLQNQLKCSIEDNKEKCYLLIPKKLMHPTTSRKAYSSILKTLLNNKKNPSILLLLLTYFFLKNQNYLTPSLVNNVL